jgi:nucleotidyltransferase/DNA polymerase involved in DNA repair
MFATIYVPNFFLQAALRHQPELHDVPVGLINGEAAKAAIIQLNAAAEAAGVQLGMTPSQGLARTLQLVIKTHARDQEQVLDALLLHYASMLAPFVEATAPGVVTVQFTDTRRVFQNVDRVIARLRDSGITAQAGLAPTPDASFLAAHLAKPVLQIDSTAEFLAPLPIETLLTC